MRFKIILSTLGVVAMVGGLTYLGWVYGFKKIIFLYVGPYNVVYTWLALVTWLHHT
jgi:fatty acid desaturase